MNGTQRERLERAFETLKKQHITPILVLTGSTGVRERDLAYYQDLATAAGTSLRWVGEHIGCDEYGGGFWSEDGRLHYRYSGTPVTQLLFWFSSIGCAWALVEALQAEGFPVEWAGTRDYSVQVQLDRALEVAV